MAGALLTGVTAVPGHSAMPSRDQKAHQSNPASSSLSLKCGQEMPKLSGEAIKSYGRYSFPSGTMASSAPWVALDTPHLSAASSAPTLAIILGPQVSPIAIEEVPSYPLPIPGAKDQPARYPFPPTLRGFSSACPPVLPWPGSSLLILLGP